HAARPRHGSRSDAVGNAPRTWDGPLRGRGRESARRRGDIGSRHELLREADVVSEVLYFEDFPAGHVTKLGSWTPTAEEIVAFAREWDPQPFHLDDEAARFGP